MNISQSPNVETAKKGYAAFAAGDIETVLGIFDEDIEFVVPGNSAVSGTYRGKAEVTEWFGKLAEKSFTTTPSRYIADGDDVVVFTQVTAGGESAPQVDVLTFRGGKAVKVQSFGDTALQERVFGTK
jgi:ketosteroid isomerase-like protein